MKSRSEQPIFLVCEGTIDARTHEIIMSKLHPKPTDTPPERLDDRRLDEILVRGHWLRNCRWSPGNPIEQGETPIILAIPDRERQYGSDPDAILGYELHIGCGSECGIMAAIPQDEGAMEVAAAVASSGRDLIDLVLEVRRLRALISG